MKSRRHKNITPKKIASSPFFQNGSNNHISDEDHSSFFNHALSSANGYDPAQIQRQPSPVTVPLLTDAQINLAIRYNRFMYPPAQMRMLQDGLHLTIRGSSN